MFLNSVNQLSVHYRNAIRLQHQVGLIGSYVCLEPQGTILKRVDASLHAK